MKKDTVFYSNVLDMVLPIRPAQYRYLINQDTDQVSTGIIVQDLEQVFPEIINEKEGFKSVNYSGLRVMAFKAI